MLKRVKREPTGVQREPLGGQRVPKVSQRTTKMHQKIELRKRSQKGNQKPLRIFVIWGTFLAAKFLIIQNGFNTVTFGHPGKGQMHQKVVSGEVPKNGWIFNGFLIDFGMDFDSLLAPFSIKNVIKINEQINTKKTKKHMKK